MKYQYELQDGRPALLKRDEIERFDNEPMKPVAIQQVIGRPPEMAFGNSDGDFEMLELATGSAEARFGAITHHTDTERSGRTTSSRSSDTWRKFPLPPRRVGLS